MSKSETFLEDCMQGMKRYPDKWFELAVVDPQFGNGFDTAISETNWSKGRNNYADKKWDNAIPLPEYFKELQRVSVNQVIWGGQYFPLATSRCWFIWFKSENFTSADFEMAWTSFDAPNKLFRYPRVLAHAFDIKIHPTQKPVKLYKKILEKFAKPGDKILDTHMGSGSSRIAAYDMGFDFTGFEIDPDYFAAAEKRFQLFKSQGKLEFV